MASHDRAVAGKGRPMRFVGNSGLSYLLSGPRRKALLVGIQIFIVVALCWGLFRNVRIDVLIRVLRDCPWEFSFGALLIFGAERIVRPCRLALLFRGVVPLRVAIGAQSVSQVVNQLLPMRAG